MTICKITGYACDCQPDEDEACESWKKQSIERGQQIERLRRIVTRQRRELRRLNKYLGPYWAGFRKGLSMEGECRLRGIMNATFGHKKVRAAEVADLDKRNAGASEPQSAQPTK